MSASQTTVLIVDDTPINLNLLANLLKNHFRIKVANNGFKALELATNSIPDLILLDVMMPEMDGYEVCQRLKANPLTRNIPIIFITAKAESDDELHGLALGAADYLTKPIIPAIVLARVNTHIALSHARQELEQKNLLLHNEKEFLEDIVTRMRTTSPFDQRKVRYIRRLLERTGGDIILSAYRPDEGHHLLVGDFSGHGLPAAFAGPLVAYIFHSLTSNGYGMDHILSELNKTLCRQLPTQLYMASSALEISARRDSVKLWNYGMPPVFCFDQIGSNILKVESSDLPLGMRESTEGYFSPHAQLNNTTASHIYQYTDGITEAESASHEQFGEERLLNLLARINREQLPLEIVWQTLDTYCSGLGLADDAVMLETSLN